MVRVGIGSATTAISTCLATTRASTLLLSVLNVDSVRSCLTRSASCVVVGGKLVNGLALLSNLSIVLLEEFRELARLDAEG